MPFKTRNVKCKPSGLLKGGKGDSPKSVTPRVGVEALASSLGAGTSRGLAASPPLFHSQSRREIGPDQKPAKVCPVNIVGTIRKRLESGSDAPAYHPPCSEANESSLQLGQRGAGAGTPTQARGGDSAPTPQSARPHSALASPAESLSFLDTSMLVTGESVQDAPHRANCLLRSTVAELEKSRNLNRDIKDAVLAGVHGLHGLVLRLADSRSRHIAEKEHVRAVSEKRSALQHKIHADRLEAITSDLKSGLDEMRRTTTKAMQEAEAARRVVEEMSGWLGAQPEQEATSLRLVGRLLEEAHALREECSGSPMPSAGGLGPVRAAGALQRSAGEGPPPMSVSYAHAARHPLMIKSRNPIHTGDDILKHIKENVDVISLGVGVNGVRKCRDGGVAISVESAREREVMEGAIRALGDDYSVSEPRRRDPQLRLVGVVAELADARLEEALLRQNEGLLQCVPGAERSIKVVRRIKGRNAGLNNVVVSVSAGVWRALLERRVRLGYQVVVARDQSPLMQCYRCLGFSHRVAECRAPAPRCGYCAGEHDTRACSARGGAPPRCTNCAARRAPDQGHPAYSADCPEWRRWDRIARLSVRYC